MRVASSGLADLAEQPKNANPENFGPLLVRSSEYRSAPSWTA